MSYTALARRYRSRTFDEVVGQEAIARTLLNAIERNRVAHAYLFTGTRGVGKTTMARLFAKALNTPGDKPAEVADAIMHGRDTDVIEIDAASNRGIEEARDLIANSVYRPMRGPYKVYIIDEVHMLTREAFNALLKTMEEPPEHVKFILCTTESHKVPATIQSRCQRFDFRNIATRRIADHLKAVVEQEGATADPAALAAIARQARGSMRDGLSLLDRLLASGEGRITPALLEATLGLPDAELVDALLGAVAGADADGALGAADALLAKGVSGDLLLETLMDRLRDVLVLQACGEGTSLVEIEGEERARASALAGRFDAPGVVHMIALCENVHGRLKTTSAPRALLDALVVRLAMTERIADAAALAGGAPARAPATEKKTTARVSAPAPAPRTPAPLPADRPAEAPTPTPAAPTDATTLAPRADDTVEEIWRRVRARASGGPTNVMLDTLSLRGVAGGTAHLDAATAEALAYAMQRVEKITEMLGEAVGRPVRVALALREGARAPSPARPGGAPDLAGAEQVPLVKKAIDLFGAHVIRVEDDTPASPGA